MICIMRKRQTVAFLVPTLLAGKPEVKLAAKARVLSSLQNAQTGPQVQPVCYSVPTGTPFFGLDL